MIQRLSKTSEEAQTQIKKVQLKMRQLETTKVKDLQRKVHEQE